MRTWIGIDNWILKDKIRGSEILFSKLPRITGKT
jgi:hypothetical protein